MEYIADTIQKELVPNYLCEVIAFFNFAAMLPSQQYANDIYNSLVMIIITVVSYGM